MPRSLFTDDYWNKFKAIMLNLGIYDKPTLRQTVEGIYYRLRVGCPWRDLPASFGKWNAVYKRFNAWSLQEKLMGIFRGLVVKPDLEWTFIDGSIVKAHQHSSGAAHEQDAAIGKSVAGNTTKIHMAVDACGLPIHFSVTGGEVHDCKEAPALLVAKLPLANSRSLTKAMAVNPYGFKFERKGVCPPFLENRIQPSGMTKWTGASTNTATSLRMYLRD